MRITPLDVRKQEFRKAVRGLDADEVHAFLATVADEYEFVLTDNKKLRDKVIELDEKVGEYRNMEKTLRDTLLTAERVMTEARQNARKEADLILRDAQMKASQEVAGISGRVETLHQHIRELRGHRDSHLARLQSLSEAQLGLVESYRRDFESTDARMERGVEGGTPGPASRGQTGGEPESLPVTPEPVSQSIPAWDPAPEQPSGAHGSDQWRFYDLGDEQANRPRTAERAPAPAPGAPAPMPVEGRAPQAGISGTPGDPPAPQHDAPSPHVDPIPRLSDEEYDARVASVADAWSGAVPRVEADELPQGDATAIDEVSAALGMFTDGAEDLEQPAAMEGESRSVPPVRDRALPSSPWPSNELAPDGVPSEPVGQPGGGVDPAAESTDVSAGSDEQGEPDGGRWSLSRIARGLTGN